MSALISRSVVLVIAGIGTTFIVSSAAVPAQPYLVWNATASAPIGLYHVAYHDDPHYRIGDLVLVRPAAANAKLYASRGYLPLGVPLLKRIAATAGDRVCEQDRAVSIDGHPVVAALDRDSRGRSLLAWNGCRYLRHSEVFVLMVGVPDSLDGRYFGPTPVRSIIGQAFPLWTSGTH